MTRLCCPGERLLAEKNSTLVNGSEPLTIGAVNFTVGKSSMVYVETGFPLVSVAPTGPYTFIADAV